MPLLPLIVLAILFLELCACSIDPGKQAAIDEMERRHTIMVESMGGVGGGIAGDSCAVGCGAAGRRRAGREGV